MKYAKEFGYAGEMVNAGMLAPEGGGGQGIMLSVQKNEKITRTVPILKSNST